MKKIWRILSILMLAAVLACTVAFSACGAIQSIDGTTDGSGDGDGNGGGTVTYTVTFDKGNIDSDVTVSGMPSSQTVNEGEKATRPATSPSADGWTFNDWYTTSAATTAFDFDTAITADTTIYAGWTAAAADNPSSGNTPSDNNTPAVTYTVTFNMGSIDAEITGTPDPQTVESGKTASQPVSPSADGYIFNGWYTTADGDTAFSFDTPVTGNTTIYAHWTKKATTGTAVTVALKLPENFTVSGWDGTSYKSGDDLVVPSESQITNNTGEELSGWYIKYSGLEATEVMQADSSDSTSESTKVWDDCTLYPCFATDLTLGLNSDNKSGFDYYVSQTASAEGGTQKAAYSVQPYFFENDYIVGKSITNAKAVSGDYFRITAAYSVAASTEYSFKYYLANLGEDTIEFTLSQVTTGVNTSTGASKDVTLASGQETKVILTLTPGQNSNILPVVTVKNSTQVNFSLAMMVEPLSEVVSSDTEDEQTNKTVDVTAISSGSNHDPIYYWADEDNVPYDSEYTTGYSTGTRAYNYCFMTPYLADNPSGGAVLVFAGGGYNYCSNSYGNNGKDNDGRTGEGNAIAKWYNAAGISVFVVNYRTKAVLNHSGIYHELLADCLRAIRYLRYHAAEYNVDPDMIATQGYSAGGNMASLLLNSYEKYSIDDSLSGGYVSDDIDKVSAKADAGVFGYGVLGLTLSTTDSGSYSDGSTSSTFSSVATVRSTYCQYNNISADTAPCFIWQETNDDTVSSGYATTFASRLAEYEVPYELHMFSDTSGDSLHGIGVAQGYTYAKVWPTYATNFLKALGF
ncbi:MAG: InlB B-repeat-containing protein [Clostridia bacterium]|nr:InlB B-repeat-containing protein [Clostridia bacterium]